MDCRPRRLRQIVPGHKLYEARKLSSLWYQADAGDADLATFFHYLGIAAKTSGYRRVKLLPHLTPEYLPGLKIYVRRFFEDFFSRFDTPFFLVFDNCQEIPADSLFHQAMSDALNAVPPGAAIVFHRLYQPQRNAVCLRAPERDGAEHIVGRRVDEGHGVRRLIGGVDPIAGRDRRALAGQRRAPRERWCGESISPPIHDRYTDLTQLGRARGYEPARAANCVGAVSSVHGLPFMRSERSRGRNLKAHGRRRSSKTR